MVALRKNRKVLPVLRESGLFSLSLFKKDQKEMVLRFKGLPGGTLPSGGDFLASWDCRLISTMEAGDHTVCVGEVRSARVNGNEAPLTTLDYGKTYIGQY
jgi:flavin reductase (DIM6/NTAB) family NADH-FMN oxidoreductase RutF